MNKLPDRRFRLLVGLSIGIAFTGTDLARPALGASVLYSNGPILGTDGSGAPTITTRSVADSFAISTASTITGTANVGLWIDHGDVPFTVDWSIGTAPFTADIGFGTVSWSASFLFTNAFGFDIYSGSFSTPALPVAAGTYYLTLTNSFSAPPGGNTFWDRDNGPSQVFDGSTQNSNAFQIIGNVGTTAPTPEPVTFGLAALSLLALPRLRRYLVKEPGARR